MLTENLFFIPSSSSIPSCRRRPRTNHGFSSSPYQRTAFLPNHDYLSAIAAAEKEEELRRLRYKEKLLRQQAYKEAMERKKKEEEEQHRKQLYLLELERQRRRQQQEEEQQRELLRRQLYLSQLQGRKRQDQVKEEPLRYRRAKALEEIKRQERLRQERDNFLWWFHDDYDHMDTSDDEDDDMQDESMHEIVQGLDGNLYRILHENKKPRTNHMKNTTSNRRRRQQNKNYCVQQYPNRLDTKNDDHLVGEMENDDVHSNLFHEGRSLKPTHVTFKDCFNVNTNNSNSALGEESSIKANATTAFIKKDNLTKKKTKKQSSIEVEDASDSECDEEYNDCWHNRRPQAGEWIEPVEGFRTSHRVFMNK